jgi:carboxyl-terminal processing protease
MDDGSAVILSVAKYYSPSGKAIQDTGVTPNEAVQEPEPQVETDEDAEAVHPEVVEPAERKPDDDPILKRGVEVLTK